MCHGTAHQLAYWNGALGKYCVRLRRAEDRWSDVADRALKLSCVDVRVELDRGVREFAGFRIKVGAECIRVQSFEGGKLFVQLDDVLVGAL